MKHKQTYQTGFGPSINLVRAQIKKKKVWVGGDQERGLRNVDRLLALLSRFAFEVSGYSRFGFGVSVFGVQGSGFTFRGWGFGCGV